MNKNHIKLSGNNYKIIDVIEKISVADSFVIPSNKIGDGNGEAKLYIGHTGNRILDFFGERGFTLDCILHKENLLNYLDNVYSEYNEPSQNYREKDKLIDLWETRLLKVNELESIIKFKVLDQNHLKGPRVYINSVDNEKEKLNYLILRELPLPFISTINIFKIEDINSNILYYFTLNLNGSEPSIENNNSSHPEINKYVPGAEDIIIIEKEISNELIDIEIPFDPNKIRVRTTPSTIGQILNDLEDNFINMNTDFQRLPNLWNKSKQSRFIESLLLKLPVPAFYFNEKEENELEVIDGLQRISAIKNFVLNQSFKLSSLEFLHEYNGMSFSELPSTFQRRIKTFPITTYIIEKGTPNTVKYNIFKRVNTGGLELTEQEIRHAINQGIPAELIADLARGLDDYDEFDKIRTRINHNGQELKLYATKEGKEFTQATDNRLGTSRMLDRDFVTRFISFYLIDYKEYQPNLDTFLNNGMAEIRSLKNEDISNLKDNFYYSMKLAFDIFGNDAFRKRFNVLDGRKPINKALFEVISVLFAKLNHAQRTILKNNKSIFKQKFIQLHYNLKFLQAITQGTARKESVIIRFEEIQNIINETIEND